MTDGWKQTIKRAVIASPFLRGRMNSLTDDYPRVFVYHRFSAVGEFHPHRVCVDVFRWQLEQIVSNFQVMTFQECMEYFLSKGKWPARCAVITVDDGYRDFFQFGFPVLRSLGLGATFFVTANFISGEIWLWPDRLDFALKHTKKSVLVLEIGDQERVLSLEDSAGVFTAWKVVTDYCIGIPDQLRKELIRIVEEQLEVLIPKTPPGDYAAVNPEELNFMTQNKIEVGSHTLNHPILSRICSDDLENEVSGSKDVLETALNCPVLTFCYPNSGPRDINDEVIQKVVDAGYVGAVFGTDLSRWQPYAVPRMGVSNDKNDFLAKLTGLEVAGFRLRMAMGRSVN